MTTIKVITFNIHGGYDDWNPNRRPIYRLPQVPQLISKADIVFLQELGYNSRGITQTSRYQLEFLRLNANFQYSHLAYNQFGPTDVGILSRFPIHQPKYYDVPRGEFRPFDTALPSTVLEATLEIKYGIPLHMITSHFPHIGKEFNRQKDRIEASKICVRLIDQTNLPLILGGDLNAHPADTEIKMISDKLTSSISAVPNPSGCADPESIDYIFYRPKTPKGLLNAFKYDALCFEPDNTVSDHALIYVELSLLWLDESWARCLYVDLLGREPETGAAEGIVSAIANGSSLDLIVNNFLTSDEYCNGLVSYNYHIILDRAADPGGLQYYKNLLMTGWAIQSFLLELCNSDEYKSKYPVPNQFVESLYNKLLGRPSDPGGKQYWLNIINSGTSSPKDVVWNFLHSDEYARKRITEFYHKFHTRNPEEPGLTKWALTLSLASNWPLQAVIRGILTSQEYRNRSLIR